jgi:hypothetical protein
MPAVSLGNALTTRLLRREGLQLGVIAAVIAVPLFFDSRALQLAAGIIGAGVCVVAAIALIVAWRVPTRRTGALLLYGGAVLVFAALAVLNLRA